MLKAWLLSIFLLIGSAANSVSLAQSQNETPDNQAKPNIGVLIQIIDLLLNDDSALQSPADFPISQIIQPKLALGQSSINVNLGSTASNAVGGLEGEGTLRFNSLNPLIASVDRLSGVVRGLAVGTTRVEVFRLNNAGFRNSDVESFTVTVADPQPQPALLVSEDPLVLEVDQSLENTVSGGAGTGAFSFSSADPSVATVNVVSGLVTGVSGGNTTITVSRAGDNNFFDATPIDYQVVVNRIPQPPLNVALDPFFIGVGESATNAAAGGAGSSSFIYTSSDPSVASVEQLGGLVTGVTEGSTTITVSRAGDSRFLDAIPLVFTVQVNRLEQEPLTVDFDPVFVHARLRHELEIFGGGSGIGNDSSLTSSDPSIAVESNQFDIIGNTQGATVFTLSREGDEQFLDATPINFQVVVAARPTISTDPLIVEIGQSQVNAAISAEGTSVFSYINYLRTDSPQPGAVTTAAFNYVSSDTNIATVNATMGIVTGIAEGSATITISRVGDGIEELDPISYTVQVERRDQDPLVPIENPVFVNIDETVPGLNAISGGSGDGAFSFESADPSIANVDAISGLITGVSAGTTTITVSREGNDLFLDAAPIDLIIEVQRLTQSPLIATSDPLVLEIDETAVNTITGGSGDGVLAFTSANPSVATVNATTGLVTAIAEGITTITVNRSGNDRFLDATPIDFTVQVVRLEQSPLIALGVPLIIEIDESNTVDITGGSGDGAFSFVSADPSVASVDSITGVVTGVSEGNTIITISRAGNDRFLEATPIDFVVQVNRLPQAPLTVLADPLLLLIDQTSANGFAGGSGDGAFSFVSTDPSVASVDSITGVVTGVSEGNTIITVSRAGNNRFLDATPLDVDVQVSRLPQAALTVLTDPLLLEIDQTSTNGFGGGSGDGSFSFFSANPSIATVDLLSGLVTGIAEGVTTISVSRAGNDRFLDATDLNYTVQISRITPPPLSVNSDPFVLEIGQSGVNTLSGGAGTGAISFITSDSAIADVDPVTGLIVGISEGLATITVSQAGDARFLESDPLDFTVLVNRIPQPALNAQNDPFEVDIGQTIANLITGGAGTGEFTFISADTNIATVSSRTGLVTGVSEGTTAITVSRDGDDDFLDATPILYQVIVNRLLQADLTVSNDPLTLEIGQSSTNTILGGSGTGVLNFISADPGIATVDAVTGLVTGIAAAGFPGETTLGVTTITVSRAGDTNFQDATPVDFTVQVTRVAQPPLVATQDPLVLNIGQSVINVTGGASEGIPFLFNIVGGEFATFDPFNNLVIGLGAGNATITVGRDGTDFFLDAVPVTFDVIVNRLAQPPLEFNETELTLMIGEVASNVATGGDGTGAISYTSADPLVATVNVNTGVVTPIAIGTTTITANRAGDAIFLDADPISYPVTITAEACTWDSSNWDDCEWQ